MRDEPYKPPKRPDGRRYTGSLSLGDLVRLGDTLTVSCLYCRHSARLKPADVAALARRLGEDFAAPDLPRRFKCSQCGSRRVDVKKGEPG